MAKPKQRGFTIIEVLIVLAIAGLILLIIILAVPAVQRSARNSRRKRDLGRFFAALQEYSSNRGTQRAPFPGDDGDHYPHDPTTNAQDEAAFEDFIDDIKTTQGGFESYDVPWIEGDNAPHNRDIHPDQIIYFALHYCNDIGSGNVVSDATHGPSIYSVSIGLEPDHTFYCLDNDK